MCLVHICQQNLLPARIFSRSVSEEWTSALKQVGLSALLIIFLLAAAVRAENKEYLRYFSTSWFSFSNFSTEGTAGFEPPPEQQQLQNQVAIGGHPLPGQQQYPVMYEGAVTEAGLPEQPAHPIGGAEGGAYDEQLAAHFLQTMQKTSDGDNFSKLEKGVGGGGMLLYQTNGDFYTDTLKWHPAHTVFKWNMFNRDLYTKRPDNVNSRDRVEL